jgi:hypothetical protein
MAKKKMTEKEKQDWESLYFYVKNLLGYDENQALSSTMVLRLKGLLTNKFMENGNIKDGANYSYEVILNTFKFCKLDIEKALRTGNFKDEMHRFNYVLKIVEKNINTVYMKMKGKKKVNEEIETVDTTIANYVGVEYKAKESKKDKFSDLW